MAIIRDLYKVENSKLHDAILLTELINDNKYNFIKLYIDPNRECAVYFKGILPLKDIQAFFFNLKEGVTSLSRIEDESIEAFKDYEYNYDDNITAIYTRDGWKY